MKDLLAKAIAIFLTYGAALGPAHAEPYPGPGRQLTIIVPFPPGGGADTLGRLIAQKLSQMWGVATVVENKSGGETIIGMAALANARKDGYTIGIATAEFVINRITQAALPYDPVRDFQSVTMLAKMPLYLVVNANSDIRSFDDLRKVSASDPDKLTYSSCCLIIHFSTELFKSASKVGGVHVPYKGSGPAVMAVLSGETTYTLETPFSTRSFIDAGKLRPLAIAAKERSSARPSVPTMAELGLPRDFALGAWIGVMMPAGVPTQAIDKMNEAIKQILEMPDVKQRFSELGVDPFFGTPQDMNGFLQAEYSRFAEVAKDNNLVPRR